MERERDLNSMVGATQVHSKEALQDLVGDHIVTRTACRKGVRRALHVDPHLDQNDAEEANDDEAP